MKIISLTQRSFQNAVREAAETIMRGGVVLAPTDTVYGLIANMADRKAIQKIYSIKKRDSQKPLPVFVKSIVAAKKLAAVSQKNEAFLETAWPGKITAILARKKDQKYLELRQNLSRCAFLITTLSTLCSRPWGCHYPQPRQIFRDVLHQ